MSRIARIIFWVALVLVLIAVIISGVRTGEWLGSVIAGVLVALMALGLVALGDLLWSVIRQRQANRKS